MKKKLLAMLLVAATAGAFVFAGCGGGEGDETPHTTHTYDRQVAEEEYLASEATCTEKAKYYYSCECGEQGTETFESGGFAAHTYNKQVVEKQYLKSAATISKKAVYYLSCKCGEKGVDTFEYGEKLIPTEGLDYELNEAETEYLVKGIGQATDTDIVIPNEVGGKSVTSIGEMAFLECGEITSIYIPDSVTSIGEMAFVECVGIASLNIPDGVTSIGESAFYGCSGLESITVGDNNTNYKSENECILSKDGKTLILGCKNSVIPDSVTIIGADAFGGCSGLTSITISHNITSIGVSAFDGCTGLTNITIPDGVTSIGDHAFGNCSGLTSITIPNSVTSIGNAAFSRCGKLTSITIPDGVTSIGEDTFEDCSELTSITIPVTVTSIGRYAFASCSGLASIIFSGTKAQWVAIEKMSVNWNSGTGDYIIQCKDGKLNKAEEEIE